MTPVTDDVLDDQFDDEVDLCFGAAVPASHGYAVELRVGDADQPVRLDKFVASSLPDLSRSYVQQLIANGRVSVNGMARRSSFPLASGMVINVEVPPRAIETLEPEAIPL